MSDYIKPSEYQHLPSGVSVVYSIVENENAFLYAGSCKCIRERIRHHISDCNNENCKEYNFKLYKYLRANGGIYRFKFVILEYIEDQDDLIDREQYYYDKLRPPLNTYRPRAIPKTEYSKQHYQQNKEKLNEQHKQYNKTNAERLQQKHNCLICSGKYTNANKSIHFKSKKHQRALQKNSQK